MGKIIRLTESELKKLIKKVIKEQTSLTNRPHDKMVMDCLLKNGFKVVNTNGKYDLSMKKVVTDTKGNTNTFIVDSQEDPTVFSMRRIKTIKLTTRKTVDVGEIKIGTTTNCNDIVKFANEPTKINW